MRLEKLYFSEGIKWGNLKVSDSLSILSEMLHRYSIPSSEKNIRADTSISFLQELQGRRTEKPYHLSQVNSSRVFIASTKLSVKKCSLYQEFPEL